MNSEPGALFQLLSYLPLLTSLAYLVLIFLLGRLLISLDAYVKLKIGQESRRAGQDPDRAADLR
ncbi:hypothetical protein GCM10027048_36290 [Hymenobacter coalescens]